MHDVSGVSGAAPVWQSIAAYLHAGAPSRPPMRPARCLPSARLRLAARAGARRLLPRRQRTGVAARHRRGACGRALQHHQPARRQRLRDRSRHSAGGQRITFEGERGSGRLDGRRIGPVSGCTGRRGRGAIASNSSTRPENVAERRLRGARSRRQETVVKRIFDTANAATPFDATLGIGPTLVEIATLSARRVVRMRPPPLTEVLRHRSSLPHLLALILGAAAPVLFPAPPAMPDQYVVEFHHGIAVHDPYRALEDLKNPSMRAWFQAQGRYAAEQLPRSQFATSCRRASPR